MLLLEHAAWWFSATSTAAPAAGTGNAGPPDWAEMVTAVSTGLLVVAAGFAWFQLKESKRARHADIAVAMSRRWDDHELVWARQELRNMAPEDVRNHYLRLDSTGDVEYFALQRLPNFFEDLGVLEAMGVVELEWINETLGGATLNYWNKWRLVAEDTRGKHGSQLFRNFAGLADKIRARRGLPPGSWGP